MTGVTHENKMDKSMQLQLFPSRGVTSNRVVKLRVDSVSTNVIKVHLQEGGEAPALFNKTNFLEYFFESSNRKHYVNINFY